MAARETLHLVVSEWRLIKVCQMLEDKSFIASSQCFIMSQLKPRLKHTLSLHLENYLEQDAAFGNTITGLWTWNLTQSDVRNAKNFT